MPTAYMRPGTLSAADAGELIRRARKMLRRGLLTHRQFTLVDCLIWSARKPGSDHAIVSYTALQRLAHVGRETIAGALRRLGQLGLVQTVKRRVRVAWGSRTASRQMTSLYRFAPPATEFAARTVVQDIKVSIPSKAVVRADAPTDLLAARRRTMEARLLMGITAR